MLIKALRRKYAEELLNPLGVADIETLQVRVTEYKTRLKGFFSQHIWFDPLEDFDPQAIGSK